MFNKIIGLITTSLFIFSLIACGDDNDNNVSDEQIIEVTEFSTGWTQDEEINNQNLSANQINDLLNSSLTLGAGQSYYIVYYIEYHALQDSDQERMLTVSLQTDNVELINAQMKNAPNLSQDDFANLSSDQGEIITNEITARVSRNKNETESLLIVLEAQPDSTGDSQWNFALDTHKDSMVENLYLEGSIDSSDYKRYNIEQTEIETPEISYDAPNNQLAWLHVEFADKYQIYVDGEEFEIIDASNESVGETLYFPMEEIPSDSAVRIRAFKDGDALFKSSNLSNTFFID